MTNEQCAAETGEPSARCIRCPEECSEQFRFRACVWFDPTPLEM